MNQQMKAVNSNIKGINELFLIDNNLHFLFIPFIPFTPLIPFIHLDPVIPMICFIQIYMERESR